MSNEQELVLIELDETEPAPPPRRAMSADSIAATAASSPPPPAGSPQIVETPPAVDAKPATVDPNRGRPADRRQGGDRARGEHRSQDRADQPTAPLNGHPQQDHREPPAERGATGPQLRRFIKSRAYVPMHELRRRFVINGGDDDVTPVDLGERRRVFVGLPEREGRLLGELLRAGDIGYELSLDPISPIVVGVYPMRPVTRA